MKNTLEIYLPTLEKVLTKEEFQIFNLLLGKVEEYKEKMKLKKGDKLKRIRDGKIFTYVERAPYGVGNAYVEEMEHYVYLADFEKIIE